MLGAVVFSVCLLQQDPDLAAIRAIEARRVAVMERCARAVCSVMDMKAPGGGSGVIIDPRGFVLTNYHVVGQADTASERKPANPLPGFGDEDEPVLPEPPDPSDEDLAALTARQPDTLGLERAEKVERFKAWWRDEHLPKGKHHYRNKKVGLPDGELYEAVVLGIDPGSDLAVLRLLPKYEGQVWPWCELGDSDALLVGEAVFAMGNPFLLATDFTPTTTFGIVSGTHRYQEGSGNRMLVYPDCIQVDAPINPGNSGGPLFNERGEVVGINGRISIGDRGRVNVGVGFAIASNQIKNFLGDLVAGKHAEHGTLDMSAWYMDAPRDEDRRRGVFVQQMFKDSVVAEAGVSLGDEITMFNGHAVRSANQLATMVGVIPARAWVTLGYRPALVDGGYGDERVVTVRMTALDTGSSADTRADSERLASRENRRIATHAILDRHREAAAAAAEAAAAPVQVDLQLTAPDGTVTRLRRRGDDLRIDLDDVAIVRVGDRDRFHLEDGVAVDCSPEEVARLDREWRANPMLLAPGELDRLESTLLIGGGLLLDEPVYCFEHEGDGELRTFLHLEGGGAGYAMRDPIRRAKVELHFAGDDRVRVIVDGEVEHGWEWRRSPPDRTVDAELFRRPQ